MVIENLVPQIEGEIALTKDECVHILDTSDEWYTVQLFNGAIGKCPKSFLKVITEGNVESEENVAMPDPYCTALYDFE